MEEHGQDYLYAQDLMLTSIVIYTALGLLLNAVGIQTWTAEWWCLLGLFIANGWHQHSGGYDQGLDHSLIIINTLERKLKELGNESHN